MDKLKIENSQKNNIIKVSTDTTYYYSGLAKAWAISEAKIGDEDYSSKYYAEKAKQAYLDAQSASEDVINNTNLQTVAADLSGDNTIGACADNMEAIQNASGNAISAQESAQLASQKAEAVQGYAAEITSNAEEAISSITSLKETSVSDISSITETSISSLNTCTTTSLQGIESAKTEALTLIENAGGVATGGGTWGSITGDLVDQIDLSNALAGKMNSSVNEFEIPYVIEESYEPMSAHRKWSNGVLEQWGRIMTLSKQGTRNIDFPIPYKDRLYFASVCPLIDEAFEVTEEYMNTLHFCVGKRTTSRMPIAHILPETNMYFWWYVVGKYE